MLKRIKKRQSAKNKAIFLDRDGTIIRHVNFLTKKNELRLLPGVAESIKALNKKGFFVFIVTNQSVVARGLITEDGLNHLHAVLIKRLKGKGALIKDVYFCPHHPEVPHSKLGIKCDCRKPEPGMILRALKDWNVDPQKSFMIGDTLTDIVAGSRAGIKTILVKTGPIATEKATLYENTKPDFIAKNLPEAEIIIRAL